MNDRQETATVNDITVDQESTVNISGSNSAANENLVNLRTLERCLNEKIDREMRDIKCVISLTLSKIGFRTQL